MVDLDALAEALEGGIIRGAGVDVFPEEPPDCGHPIFSLENVVLTPHLGGRGEDAIRNNLNHTTQCALDFFRGRRPSTVINPEGVRGAGTAALGGPGGASGSLAGGAAEI